MATVIDKIVKCTLEQYETLLKTGQVEINGVIHYKEEGTLYLPYELDFIDFYNRVKERELFRYEISHTPVAMKSLEQEYEELTADEGGKESTYVSAVGFTAVLKGGDTIRTGAPNSGCFYINGERLTHDYTYNGDGYEVVNVWCFEGKPEAGNPLIVPPQLNDTPTFNITELDVRNIAQTPVVGEGYRNYALTIRAYNFEISGLATRKLISNGTEAFNQKSIASGVEEIESDCTTSSSTSFSNKKHLKYVNFPNLKVIAAGNNTFLWNCDNPELQINFPKLTTINGAAYERSQFNAVANLIIPASVKNISGTIGSYNKTITLNCNKANSISSNWCWTTPSVNFTMCEDWQASINIAVAAKNHTKDWFIDLFRNKLYDHSITTDTGDGGMIVSEGEITIPQAMFEELMADEEGQAALQIAEDKNWTVGGA